MTIPETIDLPGGWFWMGDDGGPLVQRPAHRVFVSPFALGVMPVTRGQYQAFLEATGRDAPSSWNQPEFCHPALPVVSPSWYDAIAYCKWLSAVTGGRYRLPTEAEREYGARGGQEGLAYPWGNDYPDPATAYTPRVYAAPLRAGSGAPNGFGLYNMGDTVHEWCLDWYDPGYYAVSPEQDPTGPESGTARVARGGAWRHQVPVSRCAHRTSLPPDRTFTDFGFRIARVIR